ncbi:MAG: FHA domain-containing protein [Magnetococcales bacterium]|nr:FHA domain-containing protein [Magnetococcales bacterium]NGZ06010.1 FHA domain-containing protein [Magnetococcales bacterium]
MHHSLIAPVGRLPQLVFHIQEPDCNGYDFHYHQKDPREFLIGRFGPAWSETNGVRIALQDSRVSLDHCRIFPHPQGHWMIEDLGSTNGTFIHAAHEDLNSWQQVTTPLRLPDRVFIRMGLTLLSLRPVTIAPGPRRTWKTLTREAA